MNTQKISAIALAHDRDGCLIAAGYTDGTLQTYRVHNRDLPQSQWTVAGHSGRVLNIKFTPDAQSIVSCASDGSIHICATDDGRRLQVFESTGVRVVNISSSNPPLLAIGASDGFVKAWEMVDDDTEAWWLYWIMKLGSEILSLCFSHNDKFIACGSAGGAVALARISPPRHKNKLILVQLEEGRPINSIVFTKDDSSLVVMSSSILRVYTVHSASISMTAEKRYSSTQSLLSTSLSTDETCFVITSKESTRYFNRESGTQLSETRLHGDVDNLAYVTTSMAHGGRFYTISILRRGQMVLHSVATIFRPYADRHPQNSLEKDEPMNLTGMIEKDGNGLQGEGAFGKVYRGRWARASDLIITLPVAIKVLARSPLTHKNSQKVEQRWNRERALWQKFSHENVVPFLGICTDINTEYEQSTALVSLWMSHGTVRCYLQNNPTVNRRELLVGVARGLEYLHTFPTGGKTLGIAHGDVKADNVLVDEAGTPRLTDFGLSWVLKKESSLYTLKSEAGGTMRWMAPELFKDSPTSVSSALQSDVYAFAMTCLEIMTNKIPFEDEFDNNIFVVIAVGKDKKKPTRPDLAGITDGTWTLMDSCWDHVPFQRPSMTKCLDILVKESAAYRPLRLLSIDHGDLRTIGILTMLKSLFQWLPDDAKPCDYFDVISGVGTGGLLALMLGRLQMTIEEVNSEFTNLCRFLHKEAKKVLREIPLLRRTLFSGVVTSRDGVLEYLEELVARYDKPGSNELISHTFDKCRTMVIADGFHNDTPLRLRDYEMKRASMPPSSQTLAVTMQMALGAIRRKITPCGAVELLDEVRRQLGEHRQICCFVSCGAAQTTLSLKAQDYHNLNLPHIQLTYLESGMVAIHEAVETVRKQLGDDAFFRFDFKDVAEKCEDPELWNSVMTSLDRRRLADVAVIAERYVSSAEQKQRVQMCAARLVQVREPPPPPGKRDAFSIPTLR